MKPAPPGHNAEFWMPPLTTLPARLSRLSGLRLLTPIALVAIALVAIALTGCADANAPRDAFAPPCPQSGFLKDGEDLQRYNGQGHDLTDQVLKVRLTKVDGACSKGSTRDTTRTSVIVQMTASRGPAAHGRTADFSYFVAIMRGDEVLDKQTIPVHVEFPSNATAVQITGNEVRLTLPTPKGVTASDYRVVISLQLSPDELARNRSSGT